MKKIYGGIYSKEPSIETDAFLVDPKQQAAEQYLLPYYLWETLAHVLMLAKKTLIPTISAKKILGALLFYIEETEKGLMTIDPSIGDVHENIETRLSTDIGSDAGWLQTGRSRNDQVVTDQKLYVKRMIFDVFDTLSVLCKTLGNKSIQCADIPMPGLTHSRLAMPSSCGFWWQSYMVQFVDAAQLLTVTLETIDTHSLGAGASYGVNYPIDPLLTQSWLGFTKPLQNALAAIDDRGIHELYILGILTSIMTIVSRMMEDLVWMSTPEIGFFTIDQSYTTGSSIMPQKINPDVAEKSRAKVGTVLGDLVSVCIALKGTTHGYNRDGAETKTAIIDACHTVISTLKIVEKLCASVVPCPSAMKKNIVTTLATKLADGLSQGYGIPFRQAHEIVGKALKIHNGQMAQITTETLSACIKETAGAIVSVPKEFVDKMLHEDNLFGTYTYTGTPNVQYVKRTTTKLFTDHADTIKRMGVLKTTYYQAKITLLNEVHLFIARRAYE